MLLCPNYQWFRFFFSFEKYAANLIFYVRFSESYGVCVYICLQKTKLIWMFFYDTRLFCFLFSVAKKTGRSNFAFINEYSHLLCICPCWEQKKNFKSWVKIIVHVSRIYNNNVKNNFRKKQVNIFFHDISTFSFSFELKKNSNYWSMILDAIIYSNSNELLGSMKWKKNKSMHSWNVVFPFHFFCLFVCPNCLSIIKSIKFDRIKCNFIKCRKLPEECQEFSNIIIIIILPLFDQFRSTSSDICNFQVL